MIATCNVCGSTFDHTKTGIDWHNEKFLCWTCNDQGYDLTRNGQLTLHGKPYHAYSSAVAAYGPASTVDRGTLQSRELDIIQAGTDAVNQGMASPFNWGLVIVGLLLFVWTGGFSMALTLWGGWRMSGGAKHEIQAAIPRTVDTVAPKAGCIRILCALGSLVLMVMGIGLFLLLAAYQAGLLGV